MDKKEYTGRSIDEALERALNDMMLTRDDIEYDIISEPSKGFLGIGAKNAIVHVWKKVDSETILEEIDKIVDSAVEEAEDPTACVCDMTQDELDAEENETVVDLGRVAKAENKPENENAEQLGRDFLQKIFQEMKLDVKIEVTKKEGYLTFNLIGDNLGILIGRRGDTLDSLQFLLNLVINDKQHSKVKGIIDVENYRDKREQTLIHLAHKMASKALHSGQNVVMEPMNPQERRIIHMALQTDNRVTTYSEGEEPYRKVIIAPEKKGRYQKRN